MPKFTKLEFKQKSKYYLFKNQYKKKKDKSNKPNRRLLLKKRLVFIATKWRFILF